MTLKRPRLIVFLCIFPILFQTSKLMAWNEHPLITYPVVAGLPEVRDAAPVKVESLESFVRAEAEGLERVLAKEENWAKANLQWYAPLPPALAFKASDTPDDVMIRFSHAIRINPQTGFPLYLQLVPGPAERAKSSLSVEKISLFKDLSDWRDTSFIPLAAGDTARPLDVLTSASDEPDLLGPDTGLFEDNHTELGKIYGFGIQPFGNPNLEYGSQGPFHMGFYHEPKVMYLLGGFLKKTYPEYRIHLYKTLAQFAFQTGHPYWGWRFTGWGMHYLADLTQPYHADPLPGVSTLKGIWINALNKVAIHGPERDMVQIMSNRHTAVEKFVQVILQQAYHGKNKNHPILSALTHAESTPPYTDDVPRNILARLAREKADETDQALEDEMPEKFVSDPHFELGTSDEKEKIVEMILREKGQASIDRLNLLVRDLLVPFAAYGPGYVRSVLQENRN
jgi:hypothetical protein